LQGTALGTALALKFREEWYKYFDENKPESMMDF